MTASYGGDTNDATSASSTLTQTVNQASQTITFNTLSDQVFGTTPITVSATASSGLTVSFASTTSAVCTVSTATVTLASAGTCTIQATQAGDGSYTAAPLVSQSFTVTQASQNISFNELSNQVFGTAPFTVSASASSGLAVAFASNVLVDVQFGCTAGASCFSPSGTSASSLPQVGAGVIGSAGDVWNLVSGTGGLGTTGSNVALTDASGNTSPVTLSWNSDLLSTVGSNPGAFGATPLANLFSGYLVNHNATPETITIAGLVPNASYALYLITQGDTGAAGRSTQFVVNGGSPVITAAGANIGTFVGGQNYELLNVAADGAGVLSIAYSAAAGEADIEGFQLVSGGFACTVSGATVTLVAAGTCTIQATQAGNTNYLAAAPVNQSFAITQASQTITFNALSNQVFGTAPFAVGATASSGLAVSFASTTSAVCGVTGTTVTLVSVGTCTIQATQTGNINYLAAEAVNQSFIVTQSPTTTTLTSSLNPSTFGTSVAFTATLSPSTATGTVTFKDGATTLGTGTLSGGTATLNISTLSVAVHSLTASYGGDTNDATSTSSTLTQTVNQAPTTTTLTSSLNPSTFGASVTLTATLTPSTATGTVTFKDGATNLGTGTLSSGVATLNISTLSVAAHSLTASYGGDTNDATSTSAALPQTVHQATTTTTLTPSLNPSTFGTAVTLTATVAPSTSTGTVTFKDGATTIGTGILSGGTATLNTSTLSVASHSLTASYGGDTNDATSTSSTLTQIVNQATTTTTLTSSPNPSTFGASVSLTATVSPSNATGTITFNDGATILGTGTLASGTATLNLATLSVAPHSLTASYGGDTNDAISTSSTLIQTVNQAPTTTTLTSSLNPSEFGTPITFTATLAPSNATGTVTFKDGAATLGTGNVSGGTATFQTSALPTGVHSVTAVYGGDTNDAGSTSGVLLQTITVATTLTLSTGANPSTLGQLVAITATLSAPAATGKVTFYDGAGVLGISQVANGQAVLSTSLLPSGVNSLTAYYSGDSADAASSAAVLPQTVIALPGNGFQPTLSFVTQSAPSSMAIADFRRDGVSDLVVANAKSNTVSVLLDSGPGTFQDAVNYTVESGPAAVAVGDFNGDGISDLAVANNGDNTVSILLGNGDGTFQSNTAVSVGTAPVFVVVGDYNGDGIADISVANSADNTIGVLLGNGDGTFRTPATYSVGVNPRAIFAGDFNGDGKADLAVPSANDSILSVLLGNGDGTFQAAVPYGVGLNGDRNVTGADFNADGKLDIAVANSGANTISVLLGNGDGTFQSQVTYAVTTSPSSVAVGDFNGDGKQDLAVAHTGVGSLDLLFGNGDGTFQTSVSHPEGVQGIFALVADFNGDGRADIAVANNGSNNVSVLLGAIPTTTTLTSSVNPSTSGQNVTLTASVSPSTATGTVTFNDGATILGTGTLGCWNSHTEYICTVGCVTFADSLIWR